MIPKVQEAFGTKVHFDNTLLSLQVYDYDGNTSEQTAEWLRGVALANELLLEILPDAIILKSKDFARHSIIMQGKLSDNFLMTAKEMQWDIFDIGGQYVVEYPIAHQALVQTISSIPQTPYKFHINITLIESEKDDRRGIVLDSMVNFATSQFDILRYKKPLTSIQFPVLGIQKDDVEYLQDNTINLTLNCIGGQEVVQRIDTQTSVLTTQKDNFGQVTNQSVTSFISGFIFKLTAFPNNENVLVSIDLEMSSDQRKRDDDLPEIARKQVINSAYLDVNATWVCAEFQSKDISEQNNSSFFLPWKSSKQKDQTLLVTIKRSL